MIGSNAHVPGDPRIDRGLMLPTERHQHDVLLAGEARRELHGRALKVLGGEERESAHPSRVGANPSAVISATTANDESAEVPIWRAAGGGHVNIRCVDLYADRLRAPPRGRASRA